LLANSGTSTYGIFYGASHATAPNAISLVTDNTERLRITNTGNVGIGTSNPSVLLNVVNSDNSTNSFVAFAAQNLTQQVEIWYGGIRMGGTAAAADLNLASKGSSGNMLFSTNSTERMRITSAGRVWINTTSSLYSTAAQMEFQWQGASVYGINMKTTTGDGLPLNFINSSGTQVGYVYTTTNSTQYSTTSDYRLKEDLKDFNGLNLIGSLKMYDYQWKSDKSRMHGVLAHELKEIIPYAVSGDKDGDRMQGVDYSLIVPVLVKAIQELSAKVSALENKS